jgi:lysophospholipase
MPRRHSFGVLCTALIVSGCGIPDKLDPIDLEAASSPVAADFSSEADLVDRYAAEIEQPWLQLQEQAFEGAAGVQIRYRVSTVPDPTAAVVFLGGRTEAAFKHAENVFDLNAQGFTVYAMDHRGHGASDRMLDNGDKCHVEFFQDYVDDLATFIDTVVRAEHDGPLFIMAHSMGAAVTGLYLWEHPDAVDGAVLSSPMFGVDTGSIPLGVAQTLGTGVCSGTSATEYTIGHGDYSGDSLLEDSKVTNSQARFDLKLALYESYPDLQVGGATWRWVCESMWAAEHVVRLGRHTSTRTLLFQAGDEQVVLPEAQTTWCDEAPGCQLVTFEGAKHEIFSETDEVRNEALALAVRFMDAIVEAE